MQGGFTLLEIMLVLAIMVVAIAIVVPRFFSGFTASLDDEGRRLQQVMQLAADEADVSGVPLRWIAMPDTYRFERWGDDGKWQAMERLPFEPYRLPAGIEIAAVSHSGISGMLRTDLIPQGADGRSVSSVASIGEVLFFPGGSLTDADVELHRPDAEAGAKQESRRLLVRPGPGGVRLQPEKG